MTKKTSAEYQRQYRRRLREQGLVKKEVWILPENGKRLSLYEKTLRTVTVTDKIETDKGEFKMNENTSQQWTTEALFVTLSNLPSFANGTYSIELIDCVNSSIVVVMHDYGDLPIFITVSGTQILAESVLFSSKDVTDTAIFNEYVLKTHKYLPLSTISIESDKEHGDYYHMFGALCASSSINEVVNEIDTLAENVIQATSAFKTFLNN